MFPGLPNVPEDADETEIKELKRLAGIFQLHYLSTICDNILNEEDFLNPSIGSYINDETGAKMKELFMNQEVYSDVVFVVEGKLLFNLKKYFPSTISAMIWPHLGT